MRWVGLLQDVAPQAWGAWVGLTVLWGSFLTAVRGWQVKGSGQSGARLAGGVPLGLAASLLALLCFSW